MTINVAVKTKEKRYFMLRPNFQNKRNDMRAVSASTRGYLREIFS
jgi:hypothetical protein